jgi:hypothetical protein
MSVLKSKHAKAHHEAQLLLLAAYQAKKDGEPKKYSDSLLRRFSAKVAQEKALRLELDRLLLEREKNRAKKVMVKGVGDE